MELITTIVKLLESVLLNTYTIDQEKDKQRYLDNFVTLEGNRGQLKNPDISGTLYTLRSISILKLNAKMASEMSGFFN